jgi:MYXO-CTERM domain-containing protein
MQKGVGTTRQRRRSRRRLGPWLAVLTLLLVARPALAGDWASRVAAIRFGQAPVAHRCHTQTLVEAFQTRETLPPGERAELEVLLAPPPDLDEWVEMDAPFALRVSFMDPALRPKAERVLEAAAKAYTIEVEEWGFWPPAVEPGTGPFRMFLMHAGGAAGYTAPYLEDLTTPHSDAFSYVVIDPSLEGSHLDATVAHELNHASQVSMDVSELHSFMENTASYVEIPVVPESTADAAALFPYFQDHPYRPVEYKLLGGSDGYEYGGALWPLFLVHHYGDGDPAWLVDVWKRTVQVGTVNEPDYFDAIDAMLAAEGGTAEAVKRLSRFRFFVGAFDDGKHLPFAGDWTGAEVATQRTVSPAQLPLYDARPDQSTGPQPNGCNYVELDPEASLDFPVAFTFRGGPAALWDVSVLKLDASSTAIQMPLTDGKGELSIEVDGLERVMLVICHVMPPGYDPDDRLWEPADYSYDLEYQTPVPHVDAIEPAELAAGARQTITVIGGGFLDHALLEVAASGKDVKTEQITFVSSEELRVVLEVAPDAELGPRNLVVRNPGGAATTAREGLTIREKQPRYAYDTRGCAVGTSGDRPWPVALAALCLALRRRRR